MKKIFNLILAMSLILCLVSCGNSEINDNTMQEETENWFDDYAEEESEDEITESDRVISFSGDVIVTDDNILYLKSDGTIWGYGVNDEGQLGNGQRIDSDDWTQVEGIYDAVKIYQDEYRFYALTQDGKLYHWGKNIFVPEVVDGFSDVMDINISPNVEPFEKMIVTCEDGQQYVEMIVDNFYEYFIPLDFDNKKDIRVTSDKTILLDGELYVYSQKKDVKFLYEDSNICEKSFQEVYDLKKIPCSELLIEGLGYSESYFIGIDSGELYKLDQKNLELINQGGKNIKNYVKWGKYNEYYLFKNGTIYTRGENKYGQLGDGTYEDLWKTSWEIRDYCFKEMFFRYGRIVAIDYDNNVWGWGNGFGNEPSVIIAAEEFYSN